MAVVVNEFEVVPAESTVEQQQRATEPQSARKPRDSERELDRMLRTREARALRLMAI